MISREDFDKASGLIEDYNYFEGIEYVNPDNSNKISFEELRNARAIIEQYIEEKEEQEKILKILKTKKVDIKLVLWAGQNVEAYNVVVREQKDYWWREELTQEEFDLIREWLEKGAE